MLRVSNRTWLVVGLLLLLVAACDGQRGKENLVSLLATPTPEVPQAQTPLPPRETSAPSRTPPPTAPEETPTITASRPAPIPQPAPPRRPVPPPRIRPTAGVTPCLDTAYCASIPLRRARSQEEIVALARQHLADSLGVAPETVEVLSAEGEMWDEPPACLPAPPGKMPDRAYPGPIPGCRIVLAVAGVQYEYHSGGRWLVFCGQLAN